MGEIGVETAPGNYDDRAVFERGYGAEADIRRATLEGIVDTGAAMLVLPGGEALIGRIVLEALDLAADCARRTLAPRPESPNRPMLRVSSTPPRRPTVSRDRRLRLQPRAGAA